MSTHALIRFYRKTSLFVQVKARTPGKRYQYFAARTWNLEINALRLLARMQNIFRTVFRQQENSSPSGIVHHRLIPWSIAFSNCAKRRRYFNNLNPCILKTQQSNPGAGRKKPGFPCLHLLIFLLFREHPAAAHSYLKFISCFYPLPAVRVEKRMRRG